MTLQQPVNRPDISDDEFEVALDIVKSKLGAATVDELKGLGLYPHFQRVYDQNFQVDAAYKATMPDLQNGPASLIKGENSPIQHVGISNFRLPIRYLCRDKEPISLETSVTGTVSLDADKKGINMSRIMRSFYKHSARTFSLDVICAALNDYKADLESLDARIMMSFRYPILQRSLRSGLEGYQFYNIALERIVNGTDDLQVMHLDYVYSSTCPCSLELSEHAREMRGRLATPHSQRSVARLSVQVLHGQRLWFEELIELCRNAVPTETQVMVKREDEQAFAELNAANPIFVEDAVRLFAQALKTCDKIGDFRVIASHQESLHSHDAVSIFYEGETFSAQSVGPHLFESLIHQG